MYAHARSNKCDCGYEFKHVEEKEVEVTKYKIGGRGRKYCPNCKEYVGVRTLECSCGHKFEINHSDKPTTNGSFEEPDVVSDDRYIFTMSVGKSGTPILTPSGDAPAKLSGTDRASVFTWCNEVIKASPLGKCYSIEALKYFVREFYPLSTQENKLVCSTIDLFKEIKVEQFNAG